MTTSISAMNELAFRAPPIADLWIFYAPLTDADRVSWLKMPPYTMDKLGRLSPVSLEILR